MAQPDFPSHPSRSRCHHHRVPSSVSPDQIHFISCWVSWEETGRRLDDITLNSGVCKKKMWWDYTRCHLGFIIFDLQPRNDIKNPAVCSSHLEQRTFGGLMDFFFWQVCKLLIDQKWNEQQNMTRMLNIRPSMQSGQTVIVDISGCFSFRIKQWYNYNCSQVSVSKL